MKAERKEERKKERKKEGRNFTCHAKAEVWKTRHD